MQFKKKKEPIVTHHKKLVDYTTRHICQNICECVKCKDHGSTLDKHTVDMIFFIVGMKGLPNKKRFAKLAKGVMPSHKEMNYHEMESHVGDRGSAILIMALGHLLGVWKLLTPKDMYPEKTTETHKELALAGLITIKAI